MPTGYCENCEEEKEVQWGDFSFDYEYGSIRATHRDFRPVCVECGEEIRGGITDDWDE